jgi:phosphoribosylformimino-5-aminoimidazole carboxamide ribotide isomerase
MLLSDNAQAKELWPMFELIPAIDLKGGKCVRLQRGDASLVTEFSADPVAMALHWEQQGARRLHLVDLDGAFSGDARHLPIAAAIFKALRIPVQFGGGLRTLDHVARILELGAAQAILGTVALTHPEIVEGAVRKHGEAIVVGIDARGGKVASKGWVEQSSTEAVELARSVKRLGVNRVIYTDVNRDGMLSGVNVEETAALARGAGVSVIASGGVAAASDLRRLWERRGDGIEGVILGRALYENRLDFRDAAAQLEAW